jgi:hypothetical protein
VPLDSIDFVLPATKEELDFVLPPTTQGQALIDDVLKWFGPAGERWRPYNCANKDDRLTEGCILNAVHLLASLTGVSEANKYEIVDALVCEAGTTTVGEFNDRATFPEVRSLLLKTRARLG